MNNKSVLIIDTPETCSDCILNVCGDCVPLEEPLTNDKKVLDGFDPYKSKLDNCPLSKIEMHKELIDVNAFIREDLSFKDPESWYTVEEFIYMLKRRPIVNSEFSQNWIPVTDRLPESEREVEITCTSRYDSNSPIVYLTTRAFYEDGTLSTYESGYDWDYDDNLDYNEEKDIYIIPEGWYEAVNFGDKFAKLDEEVIAWMPIPKPYKKDDV